MLKYCVEQWEKNKENLRVTFENIKDIFNYEAFSRIVIEKIFPEWEDYELNVHYYGSYSGEVVFIIHSDTWSMENLYLSHLYYGSCTVCDALLAAEESDERVNDLMSLALHFVQHMTQPYAEE